MIVLDASLVVELLTNGDAAYIALAEATNAVLFTGNDKMCKGHGARVVLFTK